MPDSPPEPPGHTPPLDPGIIGQAPVNPDPQDFNAEQSGFYVELVGELSDENQRLKATIERLEGQKTVETIRAEMVKPYANRIFWFVAAYCVGVGIMIWMTGFRFQTFYLSDVVLGVIAGSTAVSVIGLIGIVLTGLFGAAKKD